MVYEVKDRIGVSFGVRLWCTTDGLAVLWTLPLVEEISHGIWWFLRGLECFTNWGSVFTPRTAFCEHSKIVFSDNLLGIEQQDGGFHMCTSLNIEWLGSADSWEILEIHLKLKTLSRIAWFSGKSTTFVGLSWYPCGRSHLCFWHRLCVFSQKKSRGSWNIGIPNAHQHGLCEDWAPVVWGASDLTEMHYQREILNFSQGLMNKWPLRLSLKHEDNLENMIICVFV